MMQPFIIVTQTRCGSTMLQTALDAHPMIRCKGEVFDYRYVPGTWRVALQGIYDAGRHAYAAGFKLMGWQPLVVTERQPLRSALRAIPGLRVVHLQRKNVLAAFISEQVGKRTGRWQSFERPVAESRPRVRVDVDAMLKYLGGTEAAYQTNLQDFCRQESVLVHYESFLTDFEGSCRYVQRFLGVPATTLRPLTSKLENRSIRDIVTNYRDVVAALRDTKWEMLA